MVGRQADVVVLSDADRSFLESQVRRHKAVLALQTLRAQKDHPASIRQGAWRVERTLNITPKDATHWSIRSMAADSRLSHTTIRRIWTAFGLQPHRAETFKLSSDPLFVDKVQEIVGLYMSPPDRAVVLCVDEKSQIQALRSRAACAAHGDLGNLGIGDSSRSTRTIFICQPFNTILYEPAAPLANRVLVNTQAFGNAPGAPNGAPIPMSATARHRCLPR